MALVDISVCMSHPALTIKKAVFGDALIQAAICKLNGAKSFYLIVQIVPITHMHY